MSFTKKNKYTFKKRLSDYDYSDIDYEFNMYCDAKYIASVFLSDDDEKIVYYMKMLHIENKFHFTTVNDILDGMALYAETYGDMTNFVYYILSSYKKKFFLI